jgi:hypothetical protein
MSSATIEATSAIIHPLKFFNRFPQAQTIIQDNPGTTLDIVDISAAMLLPICMLCGSGENIIFTTSLEGQGRYHCIGCGRKTAWVGEKEEAAQLWADFNNPNSVD